VKHVLIAGIGNVLLGDDGVGPYVVRMLESLYDFGDNVVVADIGTPALDLTHQIVGLHSLILVDSVASDDPAGTLVLFRKEDILRETPAQRLDPHSPALSECLMTADMLGASPLNVLLVGIAGKCYEPGEPLGAAVRKSVGQAIDEILLELRRLGHAFQKKLSPEEPSIWWSDHHSSIPSRLKDNSKSSSESLSLPHQNLGAINFRDSASH
jgi:hydrogenase maturation protease